MNNLVIPPSPNWYETDILSCAPDNTLIYGSRQDLIVIKPTSEGQPDDVQIISKGHSTRVKSVNINRNWGQPHKYAVTASEDKIIKLWDIETLEKKSSHNKHTLLEDDSKMVGASFAGDDRVISITEIGTAVIWNITKNETTVVNSLFDSKVTVTCLSICPHATWLAGFGLKSGLVVVADLRRTGTILYKLRGHDKAIVSLSWCPAPVNIFPLRPTNKVVEKSLEEAIKVDLKNTIEENGNSCKKYEDEKRNGDQMLKEISGVANKELAESLSFSNKELSETTEERTIKRKQKNPKKAPNSLISLLLADDEPRELGKINDSENDLKYSENNSLKECQDTTEERTINRKQKKINKAPNPWVGLIHADDNPRELGKMIDSENDLKCSENNFLKECQDLKKQIIQRSTPKVENIEESSVGQDSACGQQSASRIILKPRKNIPKCNLSDLLVKKEQALGKEMDAIQKDSVETSDTFISNTSETSETGTIETLTEGEQMSPTISGKDSKLTDNNEKSMETCGLKESTNTVDNEATIGLSVPSDSKESSDVSKLDTTNSSDDSRKFSSASTCDNDINCSKVLKEISDLKEVKKSETDSEDVFHDAQVCENKSVNGSENWRSEEPTSLEEQPRKDFLLASSAREPNIYIWRAGTDGRMQTFLTVPTTKSHKNTTRKDKIWITVCWVAPNILLSSSRNAELLQWTLPKPMLQAKCVRQIHKDHWSVLFSIKAPIMYLSEHNFLQKREINAWTTGMDRAILDTDIGSHKNLRCYPALGGSVNCFTGSPLDPNRLAFGTGEGIVNVWDLSREHKKRIIFSHFYQKILSSVTTLAWHPTIETSLAWGTIEGRIGVIDIGGKSKPPKILKHYFKSQIYKIEWGPLNGDMKNPGLFVVSESKVAVFDPKSHEKDPQTLEMPDNTSVYTMSWKPDYSFLLVSSKSGSLISYTPDLKISNVSYLRMKLQSIVWNPNASSNDLQVSKYCQTFVSVVKASEFVIYDLGVQSDNNDDKVIAHFANRGAIINSIQWNPHSGSQLVFVDDCGVAQVYDIETKTVLSTYINPWLDSILSVYWSPVDQDYVITGTVAHKIVVWKVSEYETLTEKEINTRRNKLTKAHHKETSDQLIKEKTEVSSMEDAKLKKSTNSSLLPLFLSVKGKTQGQNIKKLLLSKLEDGQIESNVGDNNHIDVLDVFSDQSKMEKVLDLNISAFQNQGKHHNGNLLTLFKGDISTAIKQAIEQKRVNPWIISMCPMVSPKLWQTACETYVKQLLDESEADPLEIVTYLLACHKAEEAVNLLCERSMFREAFVLAKARFGVDNSIVPEILEKWAKNMVFQGNFEVAALCYISLKKYEDAAAVLFRRSNVELLELAVELAKLSGNDELHKAVLFRFNAFKTNIEEKKGSCAVEDKESSKNIPRDVPIKRHDENDSNKEKISFSEKSHLDSSNYVQNLEADDVEKVKSKECDDYKEKLIKERIECLESQDKSLFNAAEVISTNGKDLGIGQIIDRSDKDIDIQKNTEENTKKFLESKELEEADKEKEVSVECKDHENECVEILAVQGCNNRVEEIKQELNEIKENVSKPENKEKCEPSGEPEDTKEFDLEVSNKAKDLSDLTKEANKLNEDALEVLESQDGLLTTEEVKQLLSCRRTSDEDASGKLIDKEK